MSTTNGSNGRDELREEAFHLFGRLVAESDPSRLDQWASLGLTITQLRVLFILRREPGLSAGALAERLDVTPSTLTRIMDRLVRNDLIGRVTADDDRRLVRHNVSVRGAELVDELDRGFRARMQTMFDQLSDEQLDRIVLALRDMIEATELLTQTQKAAV
jgi:DNA-binding MarR family transcriptional regulator